MKRRFIEALSIAIALAVIVGGLVVAAAASMLVLHLVFPR